jgi:hypothetical protein
MINANRVNLIALWERLNDEGNGVMEGAEMMPHGLRRNTNKECLRSLQPRDRACQA